MMEDNEKRRVLLDKIKNKSFEIEDIPTYMNIFIEIANNSEDISFEINKWNKIILFEVVNHYSFIIEVKDEKIVLIEESEVQSSSNQIIIQVYPEISVDFLTNNVDTTSIYMEGALKISGSLQDAIKFITIIEIVREEFVNSF